MRRTVTGRVGVVLLLGLGSVPCVLPQNGTGQAWAATEVLQYGVEWRLFRAGVATLQTSPQEVRLHLESAGLVSKLFRVDDRYTADFDASFCAGSSHLIAHEGRRHRETSIRFRREERKAIYEERDLSKNTLVDSHELDIPECVHEVLGGLQRLRQMKLAPGATVEVPVSDGKKVVSARVEAQALEQVKTPAGTWQTVRHEVFLFNNVLYRRPGRLFVWLTDDERRLPVQIRIRLQFHIGTVTLQLEKELEKQRTG